LSWFVSDIGPDNTHQTAYMDTNAERPGFGNTARNYTWKFDIGLSGFYNFTLNTNEVIGKLLFINVDRMHGNNNFVLLAQ